MKQLITRVLLVASFLAHGITLLAAMAKIGKKVKFANLVGPK